MATNKETKTVTDGNTLVEIELFRDNKDYKDDVFVAVNGESCVIARGKGKEEVCRCHHTVYEPGCKDCKTYG